MGYLKHTLKGFIWIGGLRSTSRILAFVRIGILARILTPLQFGVFGIASLTLSFLETITQTGMGIFLIQEKKSTDKYIDTAWVISILRGLLIFIVIYLSAGIISSFFNSSESEKLIKLIAYVALVRGFISPSRAKLIKYMKFKSETLLSTVVLLVDFSVTVILTILIKDPISIIYGLLCGAITEVILSFVLLTPRPRLKINLAYLKEIASKGKWVTGSTIFNYLFTEGDDALVGKILEKNYLGIYQVSYKISTLPLTEVTQVLNTVTFPVFVKLNNDRKRLARAFKRLLSVVVFIVVPMGIVLYLFPELVVSIFLGELWINAVPVIKIMALFGVLRSLVVSCNPLFNSLKLQKYITYYTFTGLVVMGVMIYPLTIKFGLTGTVYSVLMGTVASLLLNIFLVSKIITTK